MVAPADTDKLEDRFIVFERQYRLVGCENGQLGDLLSGPTMSSTGTYRRGTL